MGSQSFDVCRERDEKSKSDVDGNRDEDRNN